MSTSEWICDDRMFIPGGLFDQVRKMSDEEFDIFIKKLKEEEQNRSRSRHLRGNVSLKE